MRKIFLALFTCVLLFLGNKSQAQLTVTMSSVTVDSSQNASVDVTVAGFTNLAGVTFSVNWDSLVLDYVNTTNFSTSPVALTINNIGPPGLGIIKKGQLTFSWDDPAALGRTLPNGTRLFTIVFKAIGKKCATTDIVTSSKPIKINITYGNFVEDQNLINVKGKVTIDCGGTVTDPCPNPICSNPSNLTFSAPTVNAQPGEIVCIPVSVKNFKNINSGQGAFTWNPALLRYTGRNVPANGLPEMANTLNEMDSLNGKITYVWVPDNTLPKTLPDGTVIIELCFKVLGAPGSTACILIGQGTPETIWSTEAISSVPTCFVYGKVKVTDKKDQPTLRIKTGNGSGKKGDTVCVNVTVDSLINGLSFKTEFTWNQSQLKYVRTDNYNLQGLSMGNFNSTAGKLTVAWNNANPVTLPNGTAVFQICFEVLVCEMASINSAINITGVTEGSALINGNPTQIDVVATGGAITITPCVDPAVTCTLGAVTNVSCNGGSNGSVILTVTGNTANCTCLWKNSSGVIVKAAGPVASGCNLTGVAAGTYTYEVSCGGVIACSGTATVNQPTAINIPTVGVITNVGCGQNGSINISTTSGGTGPYTYTWIPNLGNTANPMNLTAGSYSVTVTDANLCTATTTPFVVGDTQGDLVVTAASTNVKCKDAGNGTISLTISGGCPTYTIVWSGPFPLSGANPQNVKPGTYTAVVTDGSNPVETKTVSVTITEPATNPSIAVTNITGTSASTGTITLTITGGTAPYKTDWSGPMTIASGNTSSVITASNLSAGNYNVTVTDANGCIVSSTSPIIVPVITTGVAPVATAAITTIVNGFNVPCFGNSTAVIRVSISAGTYPITVKLFKGAQEIKSQEVSTPTFDFTGLDAGTYRVEYTNTIGTGTPITNLIITQPSRLAATQKVECTEKNSATGTIELLLNNTGVSPYNFNWSGIADNSNKIKDLPADAYNVTVTDANGCTLTLTNIEVKDCSLQGPCYQASTIISPNGDNFNDVFLINCTLDNPSDLTIFDRWGRVVYSQSNYDNTWQGVDNVGKDLAESSYIWVLTVNFGQGKKEIHKGTVTLLRTK